MGERDLSELDWRRWYSDRAAWPVTKDIFLADAVCRLGTVMVFPFSDEMVAAAALDPAPFVPEAHEAFHDDGRPIAAVHAAWAPAILSDRPAAEFFADVLRTHDRSTWLAAHAFDPATGRARFDLARTPHRDDVVTREHWEEVAFESGYVNEMRRAAGTALPHVARALARLALLGDIRTFARPIDGVGDDVEIDPRDWEINDPLARIASCGIDVAFPRAVDREATHLVFVREKGFDTAAWVTARARQLSLIDEGITPEDVGIVGPRPSAVNERIKGMAVEAMRRHLILNPDDHTRPILRRVVEDVVGPIGSKMFEEARNRIREEFEFIKEPGAPAGEERRAPVIRLNGRVEQSGSVDGDGSNVLRITPRVPARRGTTRPD